MSKTANGMQTANIVAVVDKFLEVPKYDVTPAEVVVLHRLHFKGSGGQPFKNFQILPDLAATKVGSKREPGTRKNAEGKDVPVEITVDITRVRTAKEEVDRLRRAYPGTVKDPATKATVTVVEACFPGQIKRLPLTFEELDGELAGMPAGFFTEAAAEAVKAPTNGKAPAESDAKRIELMGMKAEDLKDMAAKLEIDVAPNARKADIVNLLLAKSNEPSASTAA